MMWQYLLSNFSKCTVVDVVYPFPYSHIKLCIQFDKYTYDREEEGGGEYVVKLFYWKIKNNNNKKRGVS